MLIESNKDSRVSLNSRSGTSSYTITPSTGIKPFMHAGGNNMNQLSTIVHTNRGGMNLETTADRPIQNTQSLDNLKKP